MNEKDVIVMGIKTEDCSLALTQAVFLISLVQINLG